MNSSPGAVATSEEGRGRAIAYAAVTVQAIISSLTYLVARRAMADLPPLPLLALRFLVAGSIFGAMLAAGGRASIPPRALWPRLLLLGFLIGPINQGFFFVGDRKSVV